MSDRTAFRPFEELDAWKLSRELSGKIYKITASGGISKDYGFKDQIQRAAVSIMNNIAEGYERGSSKEFAHFSFIARGSAGEVRSMLYIGHDLGYIDDIHFNELQELCIRVSKLLWGLIRSLRKRINEEQPKRN